MIGRRTVNKQSLRTREKSSAPHSVTCEIAAVLALPQSFLDHVGIVPVETPNSRVTGIATDYGNELIYLSLRNISFFRTYSQAMREKVEGHAARNSSIDVESTLRVLMAVPAAQELESLGRSIHGLNPDASNAKDALESFKIRAKNLIFGK